MKLNHRICITSLALALAAIGCNKQSTTSTPPAGSDTAPSIAVQSSQQWLDSLDSGSYSNAWDGAATTMKSTMSESDFEKGMQSDRAPFGKLKARDIKSQRHMTRPPGLPEGDYWVISFTATFENKANVAENVVLAHESDGNWRVAGYSLP